MTQKDLNLFSAYKKNTSASGAGGYRGIILLSFVFVMVVLLSYGFLFLLKTNIKMQIEDIRHELSNPEVLELQEKLAGEVKKNELMTRYRRGLEQAIKKYEDSRVIDTALYNALISAAPSDTTILSINIDTVNVTLNCTAINFNSPGIYAQQLNKNGMFSPVHFDSVKLNPNGYYEFRLSFGFKGGDSK